LLDTFCKAGGCTKGYQRAGFYVVGVDIEPQPNYIGDEFYQADALEFIQAHGHEFALIHSSPPCQVYGKTKHLANDGHPDLISLTREALKVTGKPYIIENVPGAPLINPTILNGAMFGILVHRVRLFETNPELPFFLLPQLKNPVKMGRLVQDRDVIQPVGHFAGVDYARKEMGIGWMTRDELAQAIPPAYTQYIGRQMREVLGI